MSDETLNGKVALITGASSGIGRAAALELASEGASLVLAARREGRLNEVSEEIEDTYGVDTLVAPTDVTIESQVKEMVSSTVDHFGQLDIVVNNAGVGHGTPIEDMSTDEFHTVMDVNVDGVFFTTREAIPHVRETDGHLVFIGSIAGKFPVAIYPIYAAAKWWTRGFAHSLAGQIGGDDIAVSVINPTGVRTEFGSEYRDMNKDMFDEGEFPEPEDVAEAISFVVKTDSPTTISELDVYRRWEHQN